MNGRLLPEDASDRFQTKLGSTHGDTLIILSGSSLQAFIESTISKHSKTYPRHIRLSLMIVPFGDNLATEVVVNKLAMDCLVTLAATAFSYVPSLY